MRKEKELPANAIQGGQSRGVVRVTRGIGIVTYAVKMGCDGDICGVGMVTCGVGMVTCGVVCRTRCRQLQIATAR